MSDSFQRPTFTMAVFYDNPRAALDWLENAFGFERSVVITDTGGGLVHSQMQFNGGTIYVGQPWNDDLVSPTATGGKNTAYLHVHLKDGIDSHCERARAAGAIIMQEPADQFFGDRTYRARDPEGHIWTFAQFIRVVSRADAEQASGLKIDAPSWR